MNTGTRGLLIALFALLSACFGGESSPPSDPGNGECSRPDGYISVGSNVEMCSTIRFACDPGYVHYSDECGCGCVPEAPCEAASDCDESKFCAKPIATCGDMTITGTCRTKPQYCTREYDPVCGCDGHTYSSACTAMSHGVNVATAQVCDASAGGVTR